MSYIYFFLIIFILLYALLVKKDDFFKFNKDAFDLLYEEGKTAPKMMSIGLHQRLIGHPARAMGLKRFLDYIANFNDIWVCQRKDIADFWYENF